MIRCIAALGLLLALSPALAQSVKLRRSFADSLKDRVTFTGTFDVFKFTGRASDDGDAHGVVSNGVIALPCVAELMNKKFHPAPSSALKASLANNDSIILKGAWRMWWEHAGKGSQEQGSIYNLETANEAHVFEIHPLLEVDTHKIYSSFIPKGFHQPAKAFAAYRKRECTVTADKENITIASKMVGYNYVHVFIVKPGPDKIEVLEDGIRFTAVLKDSSGNMIGENERLIIMAGTPAEDKLKKLKKGEVMEAVAMPRLSFAALMKHLENAPDNTPVVVPIPYELVIVGVIE